MDRKQEVFDYARKLEAHLADVRGCLDVMLDGVGPKKSESLTQIFRELVARELPELKIESTRPPPTRSRDDGPFGRSTSRMRSAS